MPESSKRARPGWMKWVTGTLVAALAFAIVSQWRQGEESDDFSGVRGVELAELLKSLDATNERLSRQIDELTATRDELKSSNQSTAEAEKAAKKRATELAILAGTVGAKGPGVTVTMTAPEGGITAAVLIDAIQELRDAGAEVIAINGSVRVIASTSFLDEDKGVRSGSKMLTSPFVIQAIGSAETLDEAVTFRGGLADRVEARGGSTDVTRETDLEISTLAPEPQEQYAQAAP